MIKKYQDSASLAAAGLPAAESCVALVAEGNTVAIDGVNVEKDIPTFGDAIYEDADGVNHAIDYRTLNQSLLPSTWTYKGPFLFMYDDDTMAHFNGNFSSLPARKYVDIVQYELNAPTLDGEEHTASIGVRVTGGTSAGYAANTAIEYTYTAETLSDVANALNAAIDAAQAELGFTNTLWCYIADADHNKVDRDADATCIVVQLDTWNDYRQHLCAGMTHVTWGNMPAASSYLKANGKSTNYRGLQTIAGGAAYWATSSTRTLTANVAVGSEAGNTEPMKKSDFLTSEYAAELRAYYPTYEDYLAGEFGIMWPAPEYGAFALPNAKELTEKYGPMMAPTKDGGTKAKFPALNWAYSLGEGNYLWGIYEGTLFMDDEHRAILNTTQRKAGKVQIGLSSRWYAQRCNVYLAWFFSAANRALINSYVSTTYQVGAVTLSKLNRK